jgi:hypothetical protein
MEEIKKSQTGREYKVPGFSGQTIKVYDGEGKGRYVLQEKSKPGKSIVDRVTEEVGGSTPFRIIDGGLSAENAETDMETIIEYVGPKRLLRVTRIKKQIELQPERAWNIRNFFRRRNHING